MSVVGTAMRGAGRWTLIGRAIMIGQVGLVARRHIQNLTAAERAELRGLLAKSKGRPANLTRPEKTRVMALVRKLEPTAFARAAAATAATGRRK